MGFLIKVAKKELSGFIFIKETGELGPWSMMAWTIGHRSMAA
jgi:hypothetical protein